ncbi:MAG: zinc ribbon domain-containing protein [Acidobacteriaceae bacterium]|jgi:hypothetical protein|nr:zinc ribbon domain-containing protein [Acidobacteriaceae bacterium]
MSSETSTNTLHPWQFFVLAALGCATAVTFLVREQGVAAVILLSVIMGATALVGIAVLHVVRPLLQTSTESSLTLGQRTRAALEQEKAIVLRTIKELEFDRAMGKVSDEDFHAMSTRLRSRAARLIKQLDAGSGYREQIEQEIAKRLTTAGVSAGAGTNAGRACASCQTVNDVDARFCKACGAKQ